MEEEDEMEVHVARVGKKRNMSRLLDGKSEAISPLGSFRRILLSNIKLYLKETD
jgi:hypothetical protein